jgi:hypothetical protein
MTGPVRFTDPAPRSDVAALLAAGAQAVAEALAENDRLRADAAQLAELVRRFTLASAELRWSLEARDRTAGDQAAAALWLVLDDARELMR